MDSTVIKLSPSEQRIMRLLARRQQTTEKLAMNFYAPNDIPPNGRIVVARLVRELEKKTNGKVRRSERAGPHPLKVWVA